MNPKLLLGLALVLSGLLSGCSTAKFKVESSQQRLLESHGIVAEVTCVAARPRYYTTFRDEYLSILAMPPRVRWSATFKVVKVLKGQFPDQTVTLVDARNAESLYANYTFVVGRDYTVAFDGKSRTAIPTFAGVAEDPFLGGVPASAVGK